MDKKVMIGIGVVIAILIIGGFFAISKKGSSYQNLSNLGESKQAKSVISNQLNSINEVISKLSNSFEMGEKEETWYQMIGAYDGTKINVDNTKIEIYQFKDSQGDAQNSIKESADTTDNIIFDLGNFVILIHSRDNEFAEEIKQALK